MYMKNGALKNKVAFYDFSEIGKNVNNRFIAAFEEEFDDKMVGRIRYLNDQTVCAFSDKGLTFISVKNVIPDTNVTFVPVDEEIQSICYSDKYAAVVVDSTSGSPYRLVYTTRMERRLQALILTTPTQASSLTGTGLSCIMRNRAGNTTWTDTRGLTDSLTFLYRS